MPTNPETIPCPTCEKSTDHLIAYDDRPATAALCTIRVLYRGADSMDLWGIPYGMRPGQGPKDILDRYRDAWIWLGSPGWFGAMDPASIERAKAFVASCGPDVPCGPYEWCYIAPPTYTSVAVSSYPTAIAAILEEAAHAH